MRHRDMERLQRMLGLSDYTITWKPAKDDTTHGEVEANPEYRTATVYLHPNADDPVGTVIHELLHVALWPFSHAADTMAQTKAEKEWLRVEEETAVHRLQQAISELLP